jgi:hypothetical protein
MRLNGHRHEREVATKSRRAVYTAFAIKYAGYIHLKTPPD